MSAASSILAPMSKPRGKKPVPADRHKPGGTIRLPLSILRQVDELVDLHKSDRTEEVRKAVLAYLTHHGLWPPQPVNKP